MKDIKMAISLFDGCSGDMIGEAKFCELVSHFGAQCVDFPSKMKSRILSRSLKRLVMGIQQGDNEAALRQFLDAINPFPKKRSDNQVGARNADWIQVQADSGS